MVVGAHLHEELRALPILVMIIIIAVAAAAHRLLLLLVIMVGIMLLLLLLSVMMMMIMVSMRRLMVAGLGFAIVQFVGNRIDLALKFGTELVDIIEIYANLGPNFVIIISISISTDRVGRMEGISKLDEDRSGAKFGGGSVVFFCCCCYF